MREIKFRAWLRGRMFYNVVQWHPAGEGEWLVPESGFPDGANLVTKDAIPMQYTGLKDKNGKEIYEGDILRYENFRDWLISWHEAGFYLQNFFRGMGDTDYFILTHDLAITREVIGNIYENPELLEVK